MKRCLRVLICLFVVSVEVGCGDSSAGVPAPAAGGGGNAMATAGTGGALPTMPGSAGSSTAVPVTPSAGMAGDASSAGNAGMGGVSSGAGSAGSAGTGGGSGGSAGSSASEPDPTSKDLVPASGLLFGAYVDGGQLAARETLLGRKLAIHHRFFNWTDNWIDGESQSDVATGHIPMSTWEPRTATLADIIAGQHDALAHERAAAAKALGKPIFLRFGHEMNGNWYPWGGANNGNDASGPQKYVAAWKHLHDLFVADGATNVLWVWCPNIGGSPNADWNTPSAYYPGDAYVDWIAVDGYNWGLSQSWSKWTQFQDILGPVYASYVAMGKPLMVAETGSVESGGDKAAWVNALHENLKTSFSAVKAFVYFDTYDELNKTDWKFDTSTAAVSAFAAMAQDPYFNP